MMKQLMVELIPGNYEFELYVKDPRCITLTSRRFGCCFLQGLYRHEFMEAVMLVASELWEQMKANQPQDINSV